MVSINVESPPKFGFQTLICYRRAAGHTCSVLRPNDIQTACVRYPDLPFYPIEPRAGGIFLARGPTLECPVIFDLT